MVRVYPNQAPAALGGMSAPCLWLVSIAPPGIFTQPKFYLMVAGELVLIYGFVWLTARGKTTN